MALTSGPTSTVATKGAGEQPAPAAAPVARAPQPESPADPMAVLEASETFHGTLDDGGEITIRRGDRIRAGHPVARRFASLFRPLTIQHEWEDATAEPGRKRGQRSSVEEH